MENSDPNPADETITATGTLHIGTCPNHWYEMSLSSDCEWNQKQPLNSMGWQMDTELTWASVCKFLLPNLDPVQRSLVLDVSKQ